MGSRPHILYSAVNRSQGKKVSKAIKNGVGGSIVKDRRYFDGV